MQKVATMDIGTARDALSRPRGELYREVAKGLTSIALALRQEVSEVDFEAMTAALHGFEPRRVAAALARCRIELLFLPKEVIDRLPHLEISNKRPDLKLIRDFYEPYNTRLHLHVFEYDGGHRQVRLEPLG